MFLILRCSKHVHLYSPYDTCRLHVAVTPFIRPIRGIQNTAESNAPENATVRLLDICHQLSHIAVEADVLLRLHLLRGVDKTRDQDLEDVGYDLPFDTTSSVTADVVRRRDAAGHRNDVSARDARGTNSGSTGTGTDHAGAEIRRVSTLTGCIGRLARYSFLI